jgi:hypothetical protein
MDFLKSWFIDEDNKTGCRFLVVDSYNENGPMEYYIRNQFIPLFSNEEQERKYTGISESQLLRTRLLYFDLIVLKSEAVD